MSPQATPARVLCRYNDVAPHAALDQRPDVRRTPPLPAVNWAAVGQTAPVHIAIGARKPEDPLPHADVVILTWTSAEWFALDHVFFNSNKAGDPGDREWMKAWHPYNRGASAFATAAVTDLWGSFQLVEIADRSGRPWRVLVFKSNAHLAHPPWIAGLTAMLRCILEDTQPDRIYSIGTAGGARQDQHLGDAVVTNAALLDLLDPQNTLDADNGNMYRCPTWFPATSLIKAVEGSLLYRMNEVVTLDALNDLFATLKTKHPNDPGLAELTLDDLLNDALRPDHLGTPKVQVLRDTPLLTADFYFVATGNSSDAYAFVEMDDAVIAREANRAGVRFACVRNISDPVMRERTNKGTLISQAVLGDWSGLIYSSFSLQTSYNGALAAWATIAGDGNADYDPARASAADVEEQHHLKDDPLEVKLAFQVQSCGTCSFFWPDKKQKQPYGPYTAYDFDVSVPSAASGSLSGASRWVTGHTRPPSFPNGEIIDGCRKAPIMTIGINPNLTAFLPGQTGAAWCYPDFSSDGGSDPWTKYAWYYRYRSVYQEKFSLDFVKKYVLPDGQVRAARSGQIVKTDRPNDSPAWTVTVRYDGDAADTVIPLPGKVGDFPFVLLLDAYPPHNKFAPGDVIAGRIAVPGGIQVEVVQQPEGYYMQFIPVLQQFQDTLRKDGHTQASLRIGEDVCQLDMVACASPHWNPGFLGGTQDSVVQIVDNCVTRNAWAIKQMVQTRPAVLYIVSQSSWDMFRHAFGAHVHRTPAISEKPVDNDYTLLRETTDPEHPAYIEFDVTVDGQRYASRTRLVITPHFSYNSNFLPQFRLSPADWKTLQETQASCIAALTFANGFIIQPPDPKFPNDYQAVTLSADPAKAAASLAWLEREFPSGYQALRPYYYDPHVMMASVLDNMYAHGALAWKERSNGTGYLDRTEGSCQFCVNRHWQFPGECRYDKPRETPPPPGFLEKVAARIVATGKPPSPPAPAAFASAPPPDIHPIFGNEKRAVYDPALGTLSEKSET